MIPESQAYESQKEIYKWVCRYAHKGAFENLKVDTRGRDNPPAIAIPFIVYVREFYIPHLYVIRGQVLNWPDYKQPLV